MALDRPEDLGRVIDLSADNFVRAYAYRVCAATHSIMNATNLGQHLAEIVTFDVRKVLKAQGYDVDSLNIEAYRNMVRDKMYDAYFAAEINSGNLVDA